MTSDRPIPAPPPAKLVFLSGSQTGEAFDLAEGSVTVGRHADQVIRFESGELIVSGAHATIRCEGDRFLLVDNDSRNGTYVNGHEVREHELQTGDVIAFGLGGPTARFVYAGMDHTFSTVEVGPRRSPRRILQDAQVRVYRKGIRGGVGLRLAVAREVIRLAVHRSTWRSRTVIAMIAVVAVVVPLVVRGGRARSERRIQTALADFAAGFELEQTTLANNLATVQARYDSLRVQVEESRDEIEGDRRFGRLVTRNYSRGVALIVFSWGFQERDGSRWLRYDLDDQGRPRMRMGPDGRPVPAVTFEGEGPILQRTGTATGFLINGDGWLLTNRHVARPWQSEGPFERNLQPSFRVFRAYFPPGDRAYALRVERVAGEADVDLALLRTVSGPVDAPVLPVAPPDSGAIPGDEVVFIGYPTGVHNLMFRVTEQERQAILGRVGENMLELADELARRGLIQPLTTAGSVSDTTALEVIHTASTTGGGSGGPLIGPGQRVVAVHYAAVQSPIQGDPFRTHRGIRMRHVWSLLPDALSLADSAPSIP